MMKLTTSATMDTIWRAPSVVLVLTVEAGLALTPNVSITLMDVILLTMVINTPVDRMDNKMIHFEQIISHCYFIHICLHNVTS